MVNKLRRQLRRDPQGCISDFLHRMRIGVAVALVILILPYFVR
jgi:hypothetical protein